MEFYNSNLFGPKIFSDLKIIFQTQNYFRPKIVFNVCFSDQKFFLDPKFFSKFFFLDQTFLKPFQAEHFRLESCYTLCQDSPKIRISYTSISRGKLCNFLISFSLPLPHCCCNKLGNNEKDSDITYKAAWKMHIYFWVIPLHTFNHTSVLTFSHTLCTFQNRFSVNIFHILLCSVHPTFIAVFTKLFAINWLILNLKGFFWKIIQKCNSILSVNQTFMFTCCSAKTELDERSQI